MPATSSAASSNFVALLKTVPIGRPVPQESHKRGELDQPEDRLEEEPQHHPLDVRLDQAWHCLWYARRLQVGRDAGYTSV